MRQCYICLDNIDKSNITVEHIFLNSIGGRLKSSELICKKCNSKLGEEIDCCLSDDLNYLSCLLNINRQRGDPQPIIGKDSNNVIWKILPGGKPEIGKPELKITDRNNGKACISIKSRSEKEARNILNGLKNRYPEIDIKEVIEKAELKKEYLDRKIEFSNSFGGGNTFRSICKTAMNYYIYQGGERKCIEHLIPYVTEGIKNNIVNFYYPDNDIILKSKNDILHSIYLVGDPKEKLLYSYIEYFSVYGLIVILNDNYDSEPIESLYIYDVINCAEVKRKASLHINNKDLKSILIKDSLPYDRIKNNLERVLHISSEIQKRLHINDMIEKALINSLMKYPEGITITPEMIQELISETMKELTPWIINNNK